MAKKKLRAVLMVLVAAVFLVSLGMTLRQRILYRQIIADHDEAAQIAGLTTVPDAVPSLIPVRQEAAPEETEEPLPEEVAALAAINLEALRAVNQDVVGWITIPGTELSYPLMQGTNNQYYLSHNWKREPSGGGSVFLEATSSQDLTAFHTIVYAHRMRNDTMFGILKHYTDPDFLREHPSVYLATDNGIYRYDIFAMQEARVKGFVYRLDLEENHLEEEFLQYCVDNSTAGTGLIPKADDQILTLSTCTSSGSSARRWAVHAVLQSVWTIE